MPFRTPRFIGFALLAFILCGGSLVYGLVWGVPRWTEVFRGTLDPVIGAYGGWALTLGIVAAGVVLIGGCLALSWFRATFDYLLLGLGILAILVFITLGFPGPIIAQVEAGLSFVVVGLCALLLAGVFIAALHERLTRRYRA